MSRRMLALLASSRFGACVAGAVVSAALAWGGPLIAQSESDPKETPVCMISKSSKDDQTFSIVLPASDAAFMASNGFVATDCRKAFASRADILAWRDHACKFASDPDQRMHELIENRLGVRPAVFCGMAELVIGQWRQSRTERD